MREIQETVYIAVSVMILALVLGFISIFISIRDDMAMTRNNEIASARSMTEYRQFNKYDNKTVYGDEVIELISLYIDTDITIYVDTPDGIKPSITINKEIAKDNPSLVQLSTLQMTFPTEYQYKAQIVYNAADPAVVTKPMTKIQGSEVTAISLKFESSH